MGQDKVGEIGRDVTLSNTLQIRIRILVFSFKISGKLLKWGLEEQYDQTCGIYGCCVVLVESALRILCNHHSWHLTDSYKYLINPWSPPLHSKLLEGRNCVYFLITISSILHIVGAQ